MPARRFDTLRWLAWLLGAFVVLGAACQCLNPAVDVSYPSCRDDSDCTMRPGTHCCELVGVGPQSARPLTCASATAASAVATRARAAARRVAAPPAAMPARRSAIRRTASRVLPARRHVRAGLRCRGMRRRRQPLSKLPDERDLRRHQLLGLQRAELPEWLLLQRRLSGEHEHAVRQLGRRVHRLLESR